MFLAKFRSPAFPYNDEMTRVVIVKYLSAQCIVVSHVNEPERDYMFDFNKCYVSIIEGVKVRLK